MPIIVVAVLLIFLILFSPTIEIITPNEELDTTQQVGGKATYYGGHDNQIEPNPNK